MGGGSHGPHIAGNEKNMQESDEAMLGKIQRIELVKFNPNHFHLEALDPSTAVTLLGGAPTMVMGATGALISALRKPGKWNYQIEADIWLS